MTSNPFFFILFLVGAAVVGALVTLFIMRRKEGEQRGEAELERFAGLPLDRVMALVEGLRTALERNTNATATNTLAASQPAPAADIKAATAALALAGVPAATPPATPALLAQVPGDETPIAWAVRTKAVPPGELVAFNAYAATFPATATYADILIGYKATVPLPT